MRALLFILTLSATLVTQAQTSQKPKLVVGIVVDQMRYDYLFRYEKKYGTGGFKRLLKDGYNVANCNYNYMPTFTGPGHTSIYTGCSPSVHGIIANEWYDLKSNSYVYCAEDSTCNTVGASGNAGEMSPRNMYTSTVGDELRINTVKKSRVYGVALKDRSSILPAGHAANAAYWFDVVSGKWISSTYYFKNGESDFPTWVKEANNSKLFTQHVEKPWVTYYDITTYTESIADNNAYEKPFPGETQPVFPHDLPAIQKVAGGYSVIKATPFGNTITKDFSKLLISNEKLGKGEYTDMICISFSSTDYVGHQFGPSSIETEDTYIRLDKDIEDLLLFLDKEIGKGKYTVFLTADHGAVEVPEYLKEMNIPGGYASESTIENGLDTLLEQKFGKETGKERYIASYSNQQVFFNLPWIAQKGLDIDKIKKATREYLLSLPEVAAVYDNESMMTENYTQGSAMLLQNGFHPKRSGHLLVNYQPGVIEYMKQGTTHGSPYTYDTHVPCLFYGCGVKKGQSTTLTYITSIAPTICNLLNIPFTNGGQPIIIDFK